MRDEVLDLRVRIRRRSLLLVGAAVLVVAAVVGWWVLAASADVRPGSFSSAGRGHTDRCSFPDEDFWAVYAGDQEVVAVQTIRNDAPWSVEVTSRSPDAFRLGALAADPGYDASISDPTAAPPSDSSDRVVIPPGREVALWIVDPQPEDSIVGYGDRTGYDRVPVRLRSLGIPRDTEIDLEKTLWVSEVSGDSPKFEREVRELCAG